tara:strand:+ start:923 stop:1711 length:789 start_codon:yes stop_codon:yes gene_type:complete
MTDTWNKIANGFGKTLKNVAHQKVEEAANSFGIETAYVAPRANPDPEDGDDDADDEEYEAAAEYDEVEDGDEGDGEESPSWAFEYEDAADNLACAAAAYRMLGHDEDIIARHDKTGRAFFGGEAELVEYCSQINLDTDGWEVWTEPDEILSLEYDQDTMRQISNQWREAGFQSAQEQFEGFHWGDESKTVAVREFPDPDTPFALLGVAEEIHYGAKKDGKFHHYYHEHGEESGTYPMIYAWGPKCYVVVGGKMRIEDRGIVD